MNKIDRKTKGKEKRKQDKGKVQGKAEAMVSETDKGKNKGKEKITPHLKCPKCGKENRIVNECGCDPENLPTTVIPSRERTFQEITLSEIRPNPDNPRKNFSGSKYDELVASIRAKNVLVPVLIRPSFDKKTGTSYELIAGERRFRAATEVAKGNGGVGNYRIPAIVQEMTDEEAFDAMTIENLQREDLTPLEEARSFKLYVDKKGPDALKELAERTGINPCYIRRRVAVLSLPGKILKSWEQGELSHGHLEQLVRLSDPNEQEEWHRETVRYGLSVNRLRDQIEARTPKLSSALFSRKEAGCLTCSQNSDVQRSLFGEEVATKTLCLKPECYKEHQGTWIFENWPKFQSSRKIETNGARFADEIGYEQQHYLYGKLKAQCEKCGHYQSIITLDGKVEHKGVCLGPKKCYDDLYNPRSKPDKKEKNPNAPRVAWHGEFFREEFYKKRIPELMTALPSDDDKVLRILLLTILEMHWEAEGYFRKKYCTGENELKPWERDHVKHTWPFLEKLRGSKLRSILQDLSLFILMDPDKTQPPMRRAVAGHLGSDLSAEWRITEEYLKKKTTKEIHAIVDRFGLFQDEKARTYLFEKLLKKSDRFDQCKKAELIKLILESGVNLFGVVPDEIMS